MTSYNLEEILEHKDAYFILQNISVKEEDYIRQIARDKEKNPNHLHNVSKPLRDSGLIQESKRQRAKYYEINWGRFVKIFFLLWNEELEENSEIDPIISEKIGKETIEKIKSDFRTLRTRNKLDLFENLDSLEDENLIERLEEFVIDYSKMYFANNEESTIQEMLVEDFFQELNMADLYNTELPEFLKIFRAIAMSKRFTKTSGESVVDALGSTKL